MNTKLLSIFALLVLLPGSALAERPQVTNLRHEVIRLGQMLQHLSVQLAITRRALAVTRSELAAVKGNSVLRLDGIMSLGRADDGSPTVVLEGANLQVTNGLGLTDTANGLGNIIIGYNHNDTLFTDQQGSHNLVLGDNQGYPGSAELVTDGILSNRDLSIVVTRDMASLVGGDQSTTVGANRTLSVGADKTETIGGSQSASVGNDNIVAIGGNEARSVGGDAVIDIGNDLVVNTGKTASISAADEIVLQTGSASTVMKKDGNITIDGKDITIKGSGNVVIKGKNILEN